MRIILSLVLWLLQASLSHAHESRPAYLEISESPDNSFDISWRRPALGDKVLSMQPVFPAHCALQGKVANYLVSGAHVSRWSIHCSEPGLIDQTISIDGLAQTLTDVLLRLQFQDGTTRTRILKPNATSMVVEGTPSSWQVIKNYAVLVTIGTWNRLARIEVTWLPRTTAYGIGALSVYWVLSRVALF